MPEASERGAELSPFSLQTRGRLFLWRLARLSAWYLLFAAARLENSIPRELEEDGV